MATAISDDQVVRADTAGDCSAFALPDDLPKGNDMTRALRMAHDGAEALEILVGERVVYLMPWSARRGGVAGFEQDLETFHVRPREYTGDEVRELLEQHRARPVSLISTPAWVFTKRDGGPEVSWHARCRFAERVKPVADPAPQIRESFEEGVPVGISGRGKGIFHPPSDLLMVYIGSRGDGAVVTTVYRPEKEDLATSHLNTCAECEQLYDPAKEVQCSCCGGGVCPWCGETLA